MISLLSLSSKLFIMSNVESSPDISQFPSPEGSGTEEHMNGCADGCADGRADGHADGKQSPKPSWADEEHVDEPAMPDTLLHLIKNGVRFKFAKPWS